jgi:hypothetical protein
MGRAKWQDSAMKQVEAGGRAREELGIGFFVGVSPTLGSLLLAAVL